MNIYLYKCHYCGVEYLPKRRNKQKYCCNSCRVNAFNIRKKANSKSNLKVESINKEKTNKVEKISMAGIGNAAIANAITDFGKAVLINNENKPATKKDLKEFVRSLTSRYYPVKNAPIRNDGTSAYYDSKQKEVVYLKTLPQWK